MLQASKFSVPYHLVRPSASPDGPRRAFLPRLYMVLGFYFFLLMSHLLCASPSPAADPFAGKIRVIDSGAAPQVVNILRAGKKGYAKAKTGDAVFSGDTVKTGPGVKTQIELADGSFINIGPDSVLRVKGHLFVPTEAKRNLVLKALKGVMRFIISSALKPAGFGSSMPWRNSSVTVETITAVAGVRGTDFVITSVTDGPVPTAEIAVLEGVVQVRNISLSIGEPITLIGNQVTSVQQGEAPAGASALSPSHREALIRLTTPVVSEPSGDPGTGKKGDVKKYARGDAERDLAAGLALAKVLDRAAAAGMSVDEMIDAVLAAGVNTYVVVYTAITEGFQVEAVVSAAVRQGVPLNIVVMAAIMAGGEMNAVIAGAVDAGAPPDAIATAVANADRPAAPVYGYTLPVTLSFTTPVVFPPSAVIVPSGATPSASPYRP